MLKKSWLVLVVILACSVGSLWANAQGFLAVKALDGVEISIGSEVKGVTYNGQLVLMLDPGIYTITAKKEGYGSSSHQVEIKSGEATALSIEMRESRVQTESLGAEESMVLGQKVGTLEIRSVPFAGANVTINGTSYGKTDLRLTSFPVGPVRITTTYGGRTIQGVFELKEHEIMKLQANFALDPPQIIELFDVQFSVDSLDSTKNMLEGILPEGYYLELVGSHGTGDIKSISDRVRVMGPIHTIRYTNGVDYLDYEQRVDVKQNSAVKIQIPKLVIKTLNLVPFSKELGVGNTYRAEVGVTPTYMQGVPLSWSSSNERVMTVTEHGLLEVHAPGTAVLTVKDNTSGLASSISVRSKVYVPQSIESKDTSVRIAVGDTQAMSVRLLPEDAAQQLVWSVVDPNVATVSPEGLVTAIKEGETAIRVSSVQKPTLVKVIPVQIFRVPVTRLVIDSSLFATPEATGTISVEIYPENATNKRVEWTSSDPSVITIDASGVFRVIKPGNAMVTVSTPDGLVRSTIQVKPLSLPLIKVEGGSIQMG